MSLKRRDSKFFYNILDIRVDRFPTDEQLLQRLHASESDWRDYCALVDFLQRTGESNCKRLVYKTERLVKQYVTENFAWYADVNVDVQKQFIASFGKRKPVHFSRKHDTKRFVVFDIRGANFCALKHCNELITCKKSFVGLPDDYDFTLKNTAVAVLPTLDTWPALLRKILPAYEERTQKTNGDIDNLFKQPRTHELPDCFYRSKFMRTFALGCLKKLAPMWTVLNVQLLAHVHNVCDSFGIDRTRILSGSDEIAVCIDDWQQGDQLCALLAEQTDVAKFHRTEMLTVRALEEQDNRNTVLLCYRNDAKENRTYGAQPQDYWPLYEKYILKNKSN